MWVANVYHQVRCLKDIKRRKLLRDVQLILLQFIVTMALLSIAGLATCYTAQRRPKSGKAHRWEGLLSFCYVLGSFFCKQNMLFSAVELLPLPFAGLSILCLQTHVYLTRTVLDELIPLAKTLQ